MASRTHRLRDENNQLVEVTFLDPADATQVTALNADSLFVMPSGQRVALRVLQTYLGGGTLPDPSIIDRGVYNPALTYAVNNQVTFVKLTGETITAKATIAVPINTPPTDSDFWQITATAPSTYTLEVTVNPFAVEMQPGTTLNLIGGLTRGGGMPLSHPVVFEATTGQPGITVSIVEVPGSEQVDEAGDITTQLAVTITAIAEVVQGEYTVTVTARVANTTYGTAASTYLLGLSVFAVVAAVEPTPTTYHRFLVSSGAGTWTMTNALADSGANNRPFVAVGRVRPNSRGDGLLVSGVAGSGLRLTTLTGHAMNADQEFLFAVPPLNTIVDGAVIWSVTSESSQYDGALLFRSGNNLVLRTLIRNAGNTASVAVDAATIPIVESSRTYQATVLAVALAPSRSQVTVQDVMSGRTANGPIPAWVVGGVTLGYHSQTRNGSTTPVTFNPSFGAVLVSRTYTAILNDTLRYDRALLMLANDCRRLSTDSRREYPASAIGIYQFNENETLLDRAFVAGNLTQVGTVDYVTDGILKTLGSSSSYIRLPWSSVLTWSTDFTVIALLDSFFTTGGGATQFALATEIGSNRYFRVTAGAAGTNTINVINLETNTTYPITLTAPVRNDIALEFKHNNAANTLVVREMYTNTQIMSFALTAGYADKIGLSGGVIFRGRGALADPDLSPVLPNVSFHEGWFIADKLLDANEAADALANLDGSARTVVTPPPTTGRPAFQVDPAFVKDTHLSGAELTRYNAALTFINSYYNGPYARILAGNFSNGTDGAYPGGIMDQYDMRQFKRQLYSELYRLYMYGDPIAGARIVEAGNFLVTHVATDFRTGQTGYLTKWDKYRQPGVKRLLLHPPNNRTDPLHTDMDGLEHENVLINIALIRFFCWQNPTFTGVSTLKPLINELHDHLYMRLLLIASIDWSAHASLRPYLDNVLYPTVTPALSDTVKELARSTGAQTRFGQTMRHAVESRFAWHYLKWLETGEAIDLEGYQRIGQWLNDDVSYITIDSGEEVFHTRHTNTGRVLDYNRAGDQGSFDTTYLEEAQPGMQFMNWLGSPYHPTRMLKAFGTSIMQLCLYTGTTTNNVAHTISGYKPSRGGARIIVPRDGKEYAATWTIPGQVTPLNRTPIRRGHGAALVYLTGNSTYESELQTIANAETNNNFKGTNISRWLYLATRRN